MRYLLDTNVVSNPLSQRRVETVIDRIEAHRAECAIPVTVWKELWYGALRLPDGSPRRGRIVHYIRTVVEPSFPILPYDRAAADWHARQMVTLFPRVATHRRDARREVDRQVEDTIIASIAGSRDLVVVTRNVKDFERFSGLRVEDWFS